MGLGTADIAVMLEAAAKGATKAKQDILFYAVAPNES
jgi:hypothetical protein